MRLQLHTTIDEKSLMELDIKIAQSDFIKNRNGYLEFLLKFLPYIPHDIESNTDIEKVILQMGAALGMKGNLNETHSLFKNSNKNEVSEADEILNMTRGFNFKITSKGTRT